ncbi:D-2-hydroxyglutarate dehydrogenase, mitochondrial isoform X2 [Leptinotarsa decemlineata]|uniref:D-2-hydroxyglutarate dehydrogenase, mitochondrial isoform X2 n=1 Tax=Leptinotarsa decemlineata TaxID=7539 RepID=UPI003D308F19
MLVRTCCNKFISAVKSSVEYRIICKKSDFTKNIYNVNRRNFNKLEARHFQFFKDILGGERMITDQEEMRSYNEEWMRCVKGISSMALKPKTTEEVSKILKFCNDNNLAVCPYGGNTGLVGGAIPVFDEIVLSAELMNEILNVDENSGVVVCQAGCILENLDNKVAEIGLMIPLDLGAKGSCHIGGNVATNAGGLKLFRYGNLHGNVLGLEVVLADGTVLDCMSSFKKDNTGYHLKNIFIGSEGTLGFITKVALQCPPRANSITLAFLGLQNFERVLRTFKKAKQDLGEILSAFEVLDTPTMEFVNERLKMNSPIGDFPYYLLIETSGSNEEHDSDKLHQFLESCMEKELVLDGTVATEPHKINAIWSIREKIPDVFKDCGYLFCYDVSLPLENYYVLVDDMTQHMGKLAKKVFGFGHMGDSNLHLQVEVDEFTREIKNHIEPFIFERTKQLNGSISAEHGMGFLKARYLNLARPYNTVKAMENLKKLFDPSGIMNPYKVLPW